MRYVYDSAPVEPLRTARLEPSPASDLRRELSARNIAWARQHGFTHEVSIGSVPAVLYREDDNGLHGNFHPAVYARIHARPKWARRLQKVHTSARRILVSHDGARSELDSSNSSDALLMNVFCHPRSMQNNRAMRALLGIEQMAEPEFGYRPRIPLASGRVDTTEIDMRLGSLLVEAKLTEHDFQVAPARLVERYRDLHHVFDAEELPRAESRFLSYQLIRGALAAWGDAESRFCVLCDARRPDLIAAWYRILQCVRPPELRCRLGLLTWQELVSSCAPALQRWLGAKYGITAG